MKKVGDLMAELGFREEGSDSVKRAFIENLVRSAGGTMAREPARATQKASTPAPRKAVREEQLSFDFSSGGAAEPETPFPLGQKRPTG